MPAGIVTRLLTTPVKGLRIEERGEVRIGRLGAEDNRRFFLVDARGAMVNGKRLGMLQRVVASYDADADELSLRFPGGAEVRDTVRRAQRFEAGWYSSVVAATLVEGPWAESLSGFAGEPLRLAEADRDRGGVDRGPAGAVTLVSTASVARLSEEAGRTLSPRRFRMLIEVAGVAAHGEDGWVDREVRAGGTLLRILGNVGRCVVTSREPDTGAQDVPTLRLLARYRLDAPTTEPLPFGVHGEVLEPGLVRVGDSVDVLPPR